MALVSETSVKHKKGLKESNVSDQAVRRARAAEHCTKLCFQEILSVTGQIISEGLFGLLEFSQK